MNVICDLQCSFQSKMTGKTKRRTQLQPQLKSCHFPVLLSAIKRTLVHFSSLDEDETPKKGWLEKQGIISEVGEVGEQPSQCIPKGKLRSEKILGLFRLI